VLGLSTAGIASPGSKPHQVVTTSPPLLRFRGRSTYTEKRHPACPKLAPNFGYRCTSSRGGRECGAPASGGQRFISSGRTATSPWQIRTLTRGGCVGTSMNAAVPAGIRAKFVTLSEQVAKQPRAATQVIRGQSVRRRGEVAVLGAKPLESGLVRRVTEKMLRQHLCELEVDSVHRKVYPTVPPNVEVSLT
jgi:HxlR-like helix-turn-helix